MKQKGMKNLDLKVLAVLLSIVIWIIVVNIDDPVKNIQFNDVPIQFINTNVLTEKNEVYEVLDGTDTVDVVVSGRRSVIEDLLILLSDIDGLYTDNPRTNPDAKFIELVESVDDNMMQYAKGASTTWGTGGMTTKLEAAKIANGAGVDMIICNGSDVVNISRILDGKDIGTVFKA